MRTMIVKKTSIFSGSMQKIFMLLKELSTLQYIASPYASFKPIYNNKNLVWKENSIFKFDFKLFSLIPLGVHTIRVIKFDGDNYEIYTNESNAFVPVWNHRIILKDKGNEITEYTDEVEIDAGWKTPIVYLWARIFYSHRQKKWIRLLNKSGKDFN